MCPKCTCSCTLACYKPAFQTCTPLDSMASSGYVFLAGSQEVVERQRREVQHLVQKGWVQLQPGTTCGLFSCRSIHQDGVIYQGCLAELSCSCPFEGICKHLQAAAQVAAAQHQPFCHNRRVQAADLMLQLDVFEQSDPTCGICYCRPLWDISNAQDVVTLNVTSDYCSCLDWRHHGVCAHLLAAAQHPVLSMQRQYNSALSSVPADPAAEIKVERMVAAPVLPAGVEEPSNCLRHDGEQYFKQIAAAVARARSQCSASKLSEEQKELSNIIRGMQTCIPYVEAELCAECLPAAKELLQKLKAALPAFKQVNTSAANVGRRKHSDRTHKPLLHRSKGSSKRSGRTATGQSAAVDQQDAAVKGGSSTMIKLAVNAVVSRKKGPASKSEQQQRFAKLKEQGAPKRTYRKLGNFTTRARKTTGPKRMPRNQQCTHATQVAEGTAVQHNNTQQGKGRKRRANGQAGGNRKRKAAAAAATT